VGKNLIKLYQTGTVIKNLTPNNLKKIPILIFDLKTQDKIAKEFKETIDKINSLEKETATLKDNLINNKHFI
jgi:restriction endonuclease S subunit